MVMPMPSTSAPAPFFPVSQVPRKIDQPLPMWKDGQPTTVNIHRMAVVLTQADRQKVIGVLCCVWCVWVMSVCQVRRRRCFARRTSPLCGRTI